MSEKQEEVVKIVMADPAVQAVGSFFGGGCGSAVNNARMFISLKPKGHGKSERQDDPLAIIGRLARKAFQNSRRSALSSRQARTFVSVAAPRRRTYQYALTDQNIDELNSWAPKLVTSCKQYPQIKDATSDQQFRGLQENVVIDRDAAARLGIQPQAVDSTLYSAFGQRQVSIIYTQQNQYHVVLEVDPQFQLDPTSLDKIYVKSPSGNQVPLSTIAHFQLDNTPLSVNHQGQFPCVTISFNLAPGVSLGESTKLIDRAAPKWECRRVFVEVLPGPRKLPRLVVDAAVALSWLRLWRSTSSSGCFTKVCIHPLTILSTIPSAGLGALLALWATDNDLDIVSAIGIILLIGIVKKNAIMMVDFALEAERQEGLSPEESIYQACLVRFRPIMMTTLAAMFGALPLAIGMGVGSELRKPLGIAIVGGLLVSQVLTLYSTPVIYLWLDQLRQRRKQRRTVGYPVAPPAVAPA